MYKPIPDPRRFAFSGGISNANGHEAENARQRHRIGRSCADRERRVGIKDQEEEQRKDVRGEGIAQIRSQFPRGISKRRR